MFGVETHVIEGPTTSSPGPMPIAWSARCMRAVPLVAAMACFAPVRRATMSSSSLTLGPVVIQPLRRTSPMAAMSSSVMDGRQNGRNVARIGASYADFARDRNRTGRAKGARAAQNAALAGGDFGIRSDQNTTAP